MKKFEYIEIIRKISGVISSLNLQEILKEICDIIIKKMGYDIVSFTVVSDQGNQVMNKVKTIAHSEKTKIYDIEKNLFVNRESPLWKIINNAIVNMNKQLIDISKYKELELYLKDSGLKRCKSLAIFPLIIKDKTIGIMSIYSFKENVFSEENSVILSFLASQSAVVIENSRLFEEILATVEKHEQIKEQLIQTEKLGTIGQLVSSVAHELNNPLTSIVGYSQLILKENLSGELFLEDIKRIHDEALRAKEIVQNLLKFTRPYKPEKIPTDINSLIMDVVSLRKYELELNNIKINYELAPCLPYIEIIPNKIRQVVLNILVNAEQSIKESKKEEGNIIISTKNSNDKIMITISDNGVGIPKENLDKIFMPFFTTKKSDINTGLGLAICSEIIKEHKGTIKVLSEENKGASFIIELPLSNK